MSIAAVKPSAQSAGNRPEDIDALPAALRELVHEFGWSVVRAFLDHGIRGPSSIRHLVYTAWQGPREAANARAPRNGVHRSIAALDDFLLRSGCNINAIALIRLLRQQGLVLMPREPSFEMAEVGDVSIASLRRSMRWSEQRFWPFLE